MKDNVDIEGSSTHKTTQENTRARENKGNEEWMIRLKIKFADWANMESIEG